MKSKSLWRKLWILPVFLFAFAAGLFLVNSASAAGLTFGTQSAISGQIGNFYEHSVCTLDSSHVAVAYRDGSDTYGYLKIGTKSGSDMSWGPASQFNNTSTNELDIECLSNDKVVLSYQDDDGGTAGKARIGSINTSTWTVTGYGTEVQFQEGSTYFTSIANLSASRFAISYSYGSSSQTGAAIVGEVSGTSITFGSASVYNGGSGSEYSNAVALSETKFVAAYSNKNDLNEGYAIVGTVPAGSGTTISYGSAVRFDYHVGTDNDIDLDRLSDTSFILSYHDDNVHGLTVLGTVQGTNDLSFGISKSVADNTNGANAPQVTSLDSTHFLVVYEDGGSTRYGRGKIGTVSGNQIILGKSVVFYSGNIRFPEAVNLNGSDFVTIFKDNTSSVHYGLTGNYTPKTLSLHGIGSIVIDQANDFMASIAAINGGININYENISGAHQINNVVTGNNIAIMNGGSMMQDSVSSNIIYFGYSITSSPTELHIVKFDLDTESIVTDTTIATGTNFNAVFARESYNNLPIVIYSEIDGSMHGYINSSTVNISGATAYDAPMAAILDGSNNIHVAYQALADLDLETVSFAASTSSPSVSPIEIEALDATISDIEAAGVNNSQIEVAYQQADFDIVVAGYNTSNYVISAIDSSDNAIDFSAYVEAGSLANPAVLAYHNGIELIKTRITNKLTGANAKTTLKSDVNSRISPSINEGSTIVVYGQSGDTTDSLFKLTEDGGAVSETQFDQEDDGPAVPELPTNVIWKILIALMAMGAVIGLAAVFRKRGVKEAQNIVAGKKAIKKTTTKKKKK